MTEAKVLKIWSDGTRELVTITSSLEEQQKFVAGYIELVKLKPMIYLIVNEQGTMMHLPYNALASQLAGTPIVGNAILTRINSNGDSVDLTDDDLRGFVQ